MLIPEERLSSACIFLFQLSGRKTSHNLEPHHVIAWVWLYIYRNSNQYLETSWSSKTGINYIANSNNALLSSGKSFKITINLHQIWFPQKWVLFNDPCKNESTKRNQTIPFPQALTAQTGEFVVLHMTHIFRAGTTWRVQHLDEMKQNVGILVKKRIQVNRKVWNLSSEICTYIHPCLAGLGDMWLVMLYWQKKIYLAGPPLHFQQNCRILHPKSFPELRSLTGFIFLKKRLDWCIYRKSITGRLPLVDNICIERLRHLTLNWTENSLETMLKTLTMITVHIWMLSAQV